MKSLNFQKFNMSNVDVLSKHQMKKIIGGHDGGSAVCVNCPAPSEKGTMCGGANCVESTNGLKCWSKSLDAWVEYPC